MPLSSRQQLVARAYERMKTRGPGKMDHSFKRRLPNHTEIAYREAVAKLKYLLAESYAPKMSLTKTTLASKHQPSCIGRPPQDEDLQSPRSEAISTKLEPRVIGKQLVLPGPELSSFVERQEQYIEQLERESEYCREELRSLIERVREVVAENEALQDKSKSDFIKRAAGSTSPCNVADGTPSIVFESRISELEAQLAEARLQLTRQTPSPHRHELEQRKARERRELEAKLEDSRAEAARMRARDAEAQLRAQQAEYRRAQAELEASRLRDELERRQEYAEKKLQEDKRQLERRLAQQLDQIKTEAAHHWEAATKSRLEAEQQRRQLVDLGRELAQKQAALDQLQEQLSATAAEKDSLREQLASSKLAIERSKQEQSRLQSEIDLHKARVERADADLAQARREQARLSDELAALEKQISVNKVVEETRVGVPSKPSPTDKDKDKELAALIFDLESKHANSAKRLTDLGDSLSEQAALVARLADQCQSLTQRLETSDRRHKEEMASLQSKINYLSSKIQESLACREALSTELDKSSPKSTSSDSNNQQQSSDTIAQDLVQPQPQPAVNADVIQNAQQITEVETSDRPLDELQYPQQQADYAENYTDQVYATNDQVYDHPAHYYDYCNDQYIPSDSTCLDGVADQHGFTDETCNDQQNYPET